MKDYKEFCDELAEAGFSLASGGNDEGVFGLIKHGWNEQPPDSPLRWHTGDAEHDPWVWRVRVLEERDDIAYSKFFFRKGGYITKEWYPYFLAARRGGRSFEDAYMDGLYSRYAQRIYGALLECRVMPVHEMKSYGGFGREDKSQFERALVDLQMGLYITICGLQQKRSKTGEEYGWASTVFCTTEEFWSEDVFAQAAQMTPQQAEDAIMENVYRLNPNARAKRIEKFIYGN